MGFKIRALRHKVLLNIKIHLDPITHSQIKNTSIFNFSSPFNPPLRWSNRGKQLYQVNLVQVPDTPTNFHRPSTSRSTKRAKALDPPNSPIESRSSPATLITYLRCLLVLPTRLHPNLSTLSVFQVFWFPPPTPQNVAQI